MLKDFLSMDAEVLTNKLFELHADYLNPKYIARRQVKRLVEKVLAKCGTKKREEQAHSSLADDKENSSQNRIAPAGNPTKKSDGVI